MTPLPYFLLCAHHNPGHDSSLHTTARRDRPEPGAPTAMRYPQADTPHAQGLQVRPQKLLSWVSAST